MQKIENEAPQKMMIMVAPNGARKSKNDHPNLPITPEELAECAQECLNAGASVLHLHVRDKTGCHSLSPDLYREAISAIRKKVGDKLILQCTSEAVGIYSAEDQMNIIKDLRPEAVSLALRELCPTEDDVAKASEFFYWLCREKIWPQYILYSPEDVARFEDMRRRGIFGEESPSVLFVLGRYDANLTGNPQTLYDFLMKINPSETRWSACCFGQTEGETMIKVAKLGGHARVGFENNHHMSDGSIAKKNNALVSQLIPRIKSSDRTLATADDIRSWFLD